MGDLRISKEMSDQVLLVGLKKAVSRSLVADAEVIRFIAEVDARRLYREQACSSMFTYCVEELGMSEGAAYRRIRVARLYRDLPEVLDALELGRVHLVGLHLLAAHLNDNNVDELLARAEGKSKRQIEALVCELAPKPDVPASIRKVRARTATRTSSRSERGEAGPLLQAGQRSAASELFPETVEGAKSAEVRPLAPARYRVQFTAGEALKSNLDRARELAGHGATVEELIEDAVALLVEELEKNKLGAGRKAGKVANPRGRYIARSVRRQVFERDGGRCTFVDERGRRCSERKGLHFDHVVPHARGGTSTADNLRLRCGPHNQLHADECFGPLFMADKRSGPRAKPR
jgi:hypothetical protein